MAKESTQARQENDIRRTSHNVLVPMDDRLHRFARKLAKAEWDPTTPRLTLKDMLAGDPSTCER